MATPDNACEVLKECMKHIGVRRVKTKDIEVETHRPDLVQKAQAASVTPPATFCELDGCYAIPQPTRPGDMYRKCTCVGACTC